MSLIFDFKLNFCNKIHPISTFFTFFYMQLRVHHTFYFLWKCSKNKKPRYWKNDGCRVRNKGSFPFLSFKEIWEIPHITNVTNALFDPPPPCHKLSHFFSQNIIEFFASKTPFFSMFFHFFSQNFFFFWDLVSEMKFFGNNFF